MKSGHFTTRPEFYTYNQRQASNLTATPATITRTTGEEEPGVVILAGHRVKLAMNQTQAYNLANNITDALAANPATRGIY